MIVIKLDTEGSFVSERIAQMARSTVTHIQTLAAATTDQSTQVHVHTVVMIMNVIQCTCN